MKKEYTPPTLERRIEMLEREIDFIQPDSMPNTVIKYASFVLAITIATYTLVQAAEASDRILSSDFALFFGSKIFAFIVGGTILGYSLIYYLMISHVFNRLYSIYLRLSYKRSK